MKKILILSITTILLLSGAFVFTFRATQQIISTQIASDGDKDIVIKTLLFPVIQEAIDDYYKPYLNTPPSISPEFMDIVSIRTGPSGYEITLMVYAYLGAHNTIGNDEITFSVQTDSVTMEGFKHVKSYDVPDWLKNYVIKWPPE